MAIKHFVQFFINFQKGDRISLATISFSSIKESKIHFFSQVGSNYCWMIKLINIGMDNSMGQNKFNTKKRIINSTTKSNSQEITMLWICYLRTKDYMVFNSKNSRHVFHQEVRKHQPKAKHILIMPKTLPTFKG